MAREKLWMIKNNIQPNITWNTETEQAYTNVAFGNWNSS